MYLREVKSRSLRSGEEEEKRRRSTVRTSTARRVLQTSQQLSKDLSEAASTQATTLRGEKAPRLLLPQKEEALSLERLTPLPPRTGAVKDSPAFDINEGEGKRTANAKS